MIKRFLPKGEFSTNVLTLLTGTSIAQAIPISLSPILTRIYTPDDFGVFALYIAIISIFGVIATGRYELAVMLPQKDSDASSIVFLSMMISVVISLFLLLIVVSFNKNITNLFGNPEISNWLYLVPISIFLSGVYQSLNYWCNRNKQYKRISASNIMQSANSGMVQLGLGSLNASVGGLIIGNIFGQSLGVFTLVKMTWNSLFNQIKNLRFKVLVSNANKYRKFPLFSSWGALLNNSAAQIPVFAISRIFGAVNTGFYSLSFKILNMPLTLLSGAISQVLFQRIASLNNETPELLRAFVLKMFLLLTAMIIPMVLVLNLYGEVLFTWVFGADWGEAGRYASILSIAFAVRFVVSPLSSVLLLDHNLKKGVLWQTIYFFTITITSICASNLNITLFLKVLVVHELILYGAYLIIIVRSTKRADSYLHCKIT